MERVARIVPTFLKPILRPIYRAVRNLSVRLKLADPHTPLATRGELQAYWRKPWDGMNMPQNYLHRKNKKRSEFLVALFEKHVSRQSSILEIGCSVGRNLNHLFLAGFQELTGVEISEEAVTLLKQAYPEMAKHATIINDAAEEALPQLEDNGFDVTFTMAVLEHIPPASKFVFAEMVRATKHVLITIEDERTTSWRHFPRNYRKVFEPLGFKQIYASPCHEAGLPRGVVARVFAREYTGSR